MPRGLALLFALSLGCATTPPPDADIAALRAAPWLQARVLSGPYGYFRFVNARFASEVCKRFEAQVTDARRVNLHGDAHLEQYAITDTGRGLSDFDDSASGPVVIDLMRFATAIHLATRSRGWTSSTDEVIDRFFAGYRAALADPTLTGEAPSVVTRLRQSFHYDAKAYFEAVAKMCEPVSAQVDAALKKALASYVEIQKKRDAALSPAYFDVVTVAQTHIGIGSALARKYLVRVHGPTDDPLDDLVLELKEVSESRRGPCLDLGAARDPLRLLTTQARIAYEPYRHPGYLVIEGSPFWVHAWARAYIELSAEKLESVEELGEVARDVGIQLGLGHPRYIAAPFDAELRREILDRLEVDQPMVKREAQAMADRVELWWQDARSQM